MSGSGLKSGAILRRTVNPSIGRIKLENGFQIVENGETMPMPSSDPAISPADALSELLQQAAATVYCRPALRALGAGLPEDDDILVGALNQAAAGRNAKAFSHLYLAALYAGRRLPAEVLELGAALLPEAMIILHTALRLDGDVAKALAAAVRSGRMGDERDAIAVIAGWLDYERRGVAAPPEFIALTRKVCREAVRMDRHMVKVLLNLTATLSGDPVVANILNCDVRDGFTSGQVLEHARIFATEPGWDESIPSRPLAEATLGSGATVKRAIPKAGRNDPCPCGSGKKFKQCCEGKLSTGDQYEVEGVTITEATSHPELILTAQRIGAMRSYELYALDPKLLTPELAERVAFRLALFHESARALEVLQAIGREVVAEDSLDELAYQFFDTGDIESLRWLLDWAPGFVDVSFEMEVLLAEPEERLRLLREKASEAFEAEHSRDFFARSYFCELGFAAIRTDPALGIVIARGVLPACSGLDQDTLIEAIEDARDSLGLDDDEPSYEIVDATERASRDEARHASDLKHVRAETSSRVGQRDVEIQRLKAQIDSMQETLKQREDDIATAKIVPREKSTVHTPPPPAPEPAEIRELREHLRRLKDNLKVEHDERNRAVQDLRAARDQLRRASRRRRTLDS